MTNEDKEDFRRLVRKFYADRPATAHSVTSVHFGVCRQMPCTIPEVEAACQFLLDRGHLKEVKNTMGSLRYFQIHADGSLAHERGE